MAELLRVQPELANSSLLMAEAASSNMCHAGPTHSALPTRRAPSVRCTVRTLCTVCVARRFNANQNSDASSKSPWQQAVGAVKFSASMMEDMRRMDPTSFECFPRYGSETTVEAE